MKKEERKKGLIEIAYKQFIKKGYENTSVDEIINKAGIAKGTYYYYFESKEATLDEVVNMLVEDGLNRAQIVLETDMKIEQKLINAFLALHLSKKELIDNIKRVPGNIAFESKINAKITETAIPLLTLIVKQGIKEKQFTSGNVVERTKIIVAISNEFFNNPDFTPKYVSIYIDTLEKILGCKTGSMKFVKNLIG